MALVHYHDSESEDDDSVLTPVDKMPPGVGEWWGHFNVHSSEELLAARSPLTRAGMESIRM